MLGLGLQATLRPKAEGAARPVQDGLVLADNFRKSPVNDELGLTFPSNGSAVFNGTSDYIQLPDPFSYTNHTIAAWVYANDLTGTSMIFDSREANIDGIILYGSNSETINYQIGNGATSATLTTPSSYLNEWVFISGTYDGTNLRLYANGSIASSSSTSISVNTAQNARIGGRAYVTPPDLLFDGNLANVAIWNRALTSDEINSVMWATMTSFQPLLRKDYRRGIHWIPLTPLPIGTPTPKIKGRSLKEELA
jgi:hypothetical protein